MKLSKSTPARPTSDGRSAGDNGNASSSSWTHFEDEGRKTLNKSIVTRPAPIKQQLEKAKNARAKLSAEAKARRNAEKEIRALVTEYQKYERELTQIRALEAQHRLRGVITPVDLEERENQILAARRSNASKRGARTRAIVLSEKRSIGYAYERDEAIATVESIREERRMKKLIRTAPAPAPSQMPVAKDSKVEIVDGATLDIFKPEIRSANPHKPRYQDAASIIVADRLEKRVSAKRYDAFVVQTEKTLAEADRRGFGYEMNGEVVSASEAIAAGAPISDVWREIALAFKVDGNITDFPYNYMIRL